MAAAASRLSAMWASTQGARFVASAGLFYGGMLHAGAKAAMGDQQARHDMPDIAGSRVGVTFATGAWQAARMGAPGAALFLGAQALPHAPAMYRRAKNTASNIFGSVP